MDFGRVKSAHNVADQELEFEEQPLLFREAAETVARLERRYKVDSASLFAAIEGGRGLAEIDPDDLYEWRLHFDFVREVERRVEAALAETPSLDEVVYSSTSDAGTHKANREQASLKLAA